MAEVGYYGGKEDEVLFSMHTVFRIAEITPLGSNPRLVQVTLTLTSDNDNDLRELIDQIRKETFPNSEGWFRLGQVLSKMGHLTIAQQVYETQLEQATEDSRKGAIYGQLGGIQHRLGKYQEAIAYYEKLIDILLEKSLGDDTTLIKCLQNIAAAHDSMSDYSKALVFYEKILELQLPSLPPTDPELASTYLGMGLVYKNMGDYPKALSYYEKELEINQE